MKHIALAIGVLALTITSAGIQADDSRHQRRLQHLIQTLEIDDSQIGLFRSVMEQHHQKRKAQHDTLRAELVTDLQGVLTADQLQTFEELGQQRRSKRGGHQPSGQCKDGDRSAI